MTSFVKGNKPSHYYVVGDVTFTLTAIYVYAGILNLICFLCTYPKIDMEWLEVKVMNKLETSLRVLFLTNF